MDKGFLYGSASACLLQEKALESADNTFPQSKGRLPFVKR